MRTGIAILATVSTLLAADSPPAETWRFDRLDRIGDHATKVIGSPRVIDTSIGKAVWFDGEHDALQLDVHPLAGAETFTLGSYLPARFRRWRRAALLPPPADRSRNRRQCRHPHAL